MAVCGGTLWRVWRAIVDSQGLSIYMAWPGPAELSNRTSTRRSRREGIVYLTGIGFFDMFC